MTMAARVSTDVTPSLRLVGEKPSKSGPSISSLDGHGYLFGQKLKHSLSPYLHGLVFSGLGLNWAQIRLESADVGLLLQLAKDPKFYGRFSMFPSRPLPSAR